MHRLALVGLVGCTSPPPAAPLSSHVAGASPTQLAPVILPPVDDPACPLSWSELAPAAPARIALRGGNDSCPEGFDAAALLARCDAPGCFRGTMRGGAHVALALDGPAGSGHFWSLGLAVTAERFTCTSASTVGWRRLSLVAAEVGPLPWLTDLDHDGTAELVVWQRLPWGDAEIDNAIFPVIYVLDGDQLVRRDDRGGGLRARVAAKYLELAALEQPGDPVACFRAVAHALSPRAGRDAD